VANSEPDLFGWSPSEAVGEGVGRDLSALIPLNRVRTLLLTAPLHSLHRNKAMRTSGIRDVDVRSLALVALDMVIEGMGLGEGIARRDLVANLARLSVTFTGLDADPAFAEACEFVVDGLVNAPRSETFREGYLAVDPGGPVLRDFEFRLLQEEDHGGRVILRATKYAINLCLRMLETEIEDAQVANEAVLEDQLRRGAIDRAVQSAAQARLLSVGLASKIEDLLRRLERDVSQVDFLADLKPQLDEARRHLERRSTNADRLIDVAEEKLDEARGRSAAELARLCETLRDCRVRHSQLADRVMRATQKYLDEQERQAFRRARSGRLPAMEDEVLRPALLLHAAVLEPLAAEIVAILQAPAPPSVFSLGLVVEACLAPRRQNLVTDSVVDDSTPEDLVPLPERWSDEELKAAVGWMESRVSGAGPEGLCLSQVLVAAEEEGWPFQRVQLLGLEALRVMEGRTQEREGAGRWQAVPRGQTFRTTMVAGDDLRLSLGEVEA
jgi:hypothetical protein